MSLSDVRQCMPFGFSGRSLQGSGSSGFKRKRDTGHHSAGSGTKVAGRQSAHVWTRDTHWLRRPRNMKAAARSIGLELVTVQAATETAIDAALASLAARRVGAVIIGSDP